MNMKHSYLKTKPEPLIERRGPTVEVSITCLMPFFQEQSQLVDTIKHSMDKVADVVSFLNPDRTPEITADQPLYVFANQFSVGMDK